MLVFTVQLPIDPLPDLLLQVGQVIQSDIGHRTNTQLFHISEISF